MSLPLLASVRGPHCPPRVDLEQASAGDWLPGVQAHVAGCTSCSGQLTLLRQENERFVAARPTERFLAQLEQRAAAPAPRRRRPQLLGLVALAASLTVGSVLVLGQLRASETGSGLTMKGALCAITLKRNDAQQPLTPGTALAAGDALRFTVRAPSDGYAAVLERDGAGRVSVIAPFGASAPVRVRAGETVLPDSAVLDETKGRETFVTIFAARPFDLPSVARVLEKGDAVSCEGCRVEVSAYDKP